MHIGLSLILVALFLAMFVANLVLPRDMEVNAAASK